MIRRILFYFNKGKDAAAEAVRICAQLCRDHGFGTDAAIRLWGEISPVAMYAGSWPCMVPGLDSFSELWLRLFDREGASVPSEVLARKNSVYVRTVAIPGRNAKNSAKIGQSLRSR